MTKRHPKNERIKRLYGVTLRQASGKADASIRQIEKAIQRYEVFTGYTDFAEFNQRRACAFKDDLVHRDLAKATILSTVNALQRFFGWLALQSGYKRRIHVTDIEFLSLSEKDVRTAKAPSRRPYPSLHQIERAVSLMPAASTVEKRDRALLAFTILTGVRDGALISLRLKHVDLARKLLVQHPREVATKFGKRIDTFFFPVGELFESIIVEWIDHLRTQELFGDDDPLFPKTAMLQDANDCFVAGGLARRFWTTAGPVRAVFQAAFHRAEMQNFTPHTFRHTLVAVAYERNLSPAELKAWSQNLGHNDLMTTVTSYGTLDVTKQGELVRSATGRERDGDKIDRLMRMMEELRKDKKA